jgi:NAD(P)-dependent dehydrogenase (short-subunit alcohol dehydrogenase family)
VADALDFTDRVILITGGATGIGRATALAFAQHGGTVVIGDIDTRAEGLSGLVSDAGGAALFVSTDVTIADQVTPTLSDKRWTPTVACMWRSTTPACYPHRTATGTDRGRLGQDHQRGPQGCVLVPEGRDRAHGDPWWRVDHQHRFRRRRHADPGMSPYVAAKHGVIGLTKAAALDYAAAGVRVNALAPGLVETPMTKGWLDDPTMRSVVTANSPMGRPAQPEEIVGMVLYLASPLASYANGGVYVVDGGQTAH